MDYGPPGSSVDGISQARILEWLAIYFSRGSSWSKDWTHISCLAGGFFATEPPGKPMLIDIFGLIPHIVQNNAVLSHIQLFETTWTVAHPASLSMEFSKQEYWSECHFLLQRIFPTQWMNPCHRHLLRWQVDSLPLSHLVSQWSPSNALCCFVYSAGNLGLGLLKSSLLSLVTLLWFTSLTCVIHSLNTLLLLFL